MVNLYIYMYMRFIKIEFYCFSYPLNAHTIISFVIDIFTFIRYSSVSIPEYTVYFVCPVQHPVPTRLVVTECRLPVNTLGFYEKRVC